MREGVHIPAPDPELDLVLERVVEVPPERVWAAWMRPEQLRQWFAPRPWSVSECDIDLRPGGAFRTAMRSPDGEEHPGAGCYLALEENRMLVWTDLWPRRRHDGPRCPVRAGGPGRTLRVGSRGRGPCPRGLGPPRPEV